MLKTLFKKRVAFVQSLFPKCVIKTLFAIFNKVSFAVSSNLVCIVILFNIITLIFPHRFRVCNAIYVEYHIVYRVVVSYNIVCTVKTRYDYRVFEYTAVNKNAFCKSRKRDAKVPYMQTYDCIIGYQDYD